MESSIAPSHPVQPLWSGLDFNDGDPATLSDLKLPGFVTPRDIAISLNVDEPTLAWLTGWRAFPPADHYRRFSVPKRRGGSRSISAPNDELRRVQRWLLDNLLARVEVHYSALAYRFGRSIVDNARLHCGKAVVVRFDLVDFFPSITFIRVRDTFVSFGYSYGVATILALLTTELPPVEVGTDSPIRIVRAPVRQLPQGACTSPALSNIVCRSLDRRLTGLQGFTYTRYADDMTFSCQDTGAIYWLMCDVEQIIADEGFKLSPAKTRVMRPHHRQVVTGLVVNQTVRVSRADVRRFRAFLHHCERDGLASVSERLGRDALEHASGYLSYVHMVNPEQAEHLWGRHQWLRRPKRL